MEYKLMYCFTPKVLKAEIWVGNLLAKGQNLILLSPSAYIS